MIDQYPPRRQPLEGAQAEFGLGLGVEARGGEIKNELGIARGEEE
jgi:hypothetical protein